MQVQVQVLWPPENPFLNEWRFNKVIADEL